MRTTSFIILFFALLIVAMYSFMPGVENRIQDTQELGLIEEVAGSGSDHQTYKNGDLVSIRIQIPEDGWVTFEVDDEDGVILFIESREVLEGVALLEFRLGKDAPEGVYKVYTTLKTVDGESRELKDTEFKIDPNEETPFIWVLGFGFLLLLVVGLVVHRGSGGRRSRTRHLPINQVGRFPDSHLSPQSMTHQKTSGETDEHATWAPPPTPPSTPQSAPLPQAQQQQPPVKQEIHHHYTPQYDQSVRTHYDNSTRTENIVDSVVYRKNK